jgi:uncharacterized protein GlcG (DUF336 family)
MTRSMWPVVAATLALVPYTAHTQTLVTERAVSLNAAHEAAMAALEQCRKDGYKVTVMVLNRAGRTAGVSGAPGGDKDAVCAQAGIDRIAKGLGG